MKPNLGLAVCIGVGAGSIEALVRHPGAPVLLPFTALTYALVFFSAALAVAWFSRWLRIGWLEHLGSFLIVAVAVANLLRAVATFTIPKAEAAFFGLCAGGIWLFAYKRAAHWLEWKPRTHLAVFAFLIGAIVVCVYAGKWQEQRQLAHLSSAASMAPNVVVIIADTVRADHVGSYGYSRPTTPAIDGLAAQGIRFERAIAPSSWTLPSHVSMLTGRYPHEHNAVSSKAGYDGRFPVLPDYMARHGYRTAAFSANTFFFTRSVGLGRGFAHFGDEASSVASMFGATQLFVHARALLVKVGWVHNLLGRQSAADINGAALDWISSTPSSHPFFVVLNYFDAHDPYIPPEPQRSKFARSRAKAKFLSLSDNLFPEMTDADWQQIIDLYDGSINALDEQVAKLTADLDRAGILQNTLLIITSDHGESFGEHGTILHGSSLYRQQTNVPLVLRWPGHIPSGKTIAQPVSTASLPATVASLALGESDPSFSVPSLQPLWTETPATWPAPLSELSPMPLDRRFRNMNESLRSITTDRWYCVVGQVTKPEIFDADDRPAGDRFDADPLLRSFLGQDSIAQLPAGVRAPMHLATSRHLGRTPPARP